MERSAQLLAAVRGEAQPPSEPPANPKSREVHIAPPDLIPMLKRYFDGRRTVQEMQEWASWILFQEELCILGWQNDDIADYYEPMWNILQAISSPVTDGPLSRTKAHAYISMLNAMGPGPKSHESPSLHTQP